MSIQHGLLYGLVNVIPYSFMTIIKSMLALKKGLFPEILFKFLINSTSAFITITIITGLL